MLLTEASVQLKYIGLWHHLYLLKYALDLQMEYVAYTVHVVTIPGHFSCAYVWLLIALKYSWASREIFHQGHPFTNRDYLNLRQD